MVVWVSSGRRPQAFRTPLLPPIATAARVVGKHNALSQKSSLVMYPRADIQNNILYMSSIYIIHTCTSYMYTSYIIGANTCQLVVSIIYICAHGYLSLYQQGWNMLCFDIKWCACIDLTLVADYTPSPLYHGTDFTVHHFARCVGASTYGGLTPMYSNVLACISKFNNGERTFKSPPENNSCIYLNIVSTPDYALV